MDFIDQIKSLADKVAKMKDQIQTEEATKNAFIMPFIQYLGYDVFNPNEVVPEFVADIGVKKGEKVDYAVLKDGQPTILIECKHWKEDLLKHNEQLFRYFTASKAKFGILTNGIRFMFFTDLNEPNVMDSDPFFSFDLLNLKETDVDELKKFHKSYFQVETITSAANDLKYTSLIKNTFLADLKAPSSDFVKYFVTNVYQGRATEKVTAYFSELVKKSIQQVISEMITERLKNALSQENEDKNAAEQAKPSEEQAPGEESKVVTTQEEIDGYQIVRAILRTQVSPARVVYRDAQSYFSIILDDNNRKPICRLYFNTAKKYIGILDASKKETKLELSSLDDIFGHADLLIAAVKAYEKE